MAVFKVGQRVKIVRMIFGEDKSPWHHKNVLGREATVVAISGTLYTLNADGLGTQTPWGPLELYACQLAPLTDPKADAFIESLKRLRYEEPRAPKPETIPERELDKYRGGAQ